MDNRRLTYLPGPINAQGVTLPADLIALQERLAENTHDVWAAQRVADGWKYGQSHNSQQKLNPLLVPYCDLPESEKEINREMVSSLLKALLALGYTIRRD